MLFTDFDINHKSKPKSVIKECNNPPLCNQMAQAARGKKTLLESNFVA